MKRIQCCIVRDDGTQCSEDAAYEAGFSLDPYDQNNLCEGHRTYCVTTWDRPLTEREHEEFGIERAA